MAKHLISCAVVAASVWATPAIDAQTPTLSLLDQQLIVAAEKEPLGRVEALLRAGARPDPPGGDGGQTALGMAAWRGDPAVVNALLAAGADPNKPNNAEEPPLMLAARRCHEQIVRILIAAGADAKRPDLLIWTLITAQQAGSRTATALAFVEAGTELNERGFAMMTPLEAAVGAGEFVVARAMIARGADVQANIAVAERQGKKELVGWLKKAAAPAETLTPTGSPAGDLLPALDTLVRRLEVRNAGDAPDLVPSDQDVKQAGIDIVTYLKSHPANADALVLWARLARVKPEAVAVRVEMAGAEIASTLNRAVKLAPMSAEAHYWRGQAYADEQSETADGTGTRYGALDRAVQSFRKAVTLAPGSVTYREALALHLADQGKPGEAAAILAAVAPGHAMLALLRDLAVLPPPPGSMHLSSHGIAFADYELVSTYSPGNLLRLRVRPFQISTSFEQVQAFYQQTWPGFQLFRDEPEPGDKPEDGQSARQFFRWINGVLTPASALADVPETPKGGMMLSLVELRNKGRRWRYLTILNFRQ